MDSGQAPAEHRLGIGDSPAFDRRDTAAMRCAQGRHATIGGEPEEVERVMSALAVRARSNSAAPLTAGRRTSNQACSSARTGERFIGDQRELYLMDAHPHEETPYERLLGAAMDGSDELFTREDAVEAAWAVVDPVLTEHGPVLPYSSGSWGPPQADALIVPVGHWFHPNLTAPASTEGIVKP